MDNINKTAIAGIAFFALILAGFVGIKVDQVTIALLGGALIGIVVAGGTTVALIVVSRRSDEPVQTTQTTHPVPTVTHYHTHNNTIYVHVSRPDLSNFDKCTEVANTLRVSRYRAERMIEAGEVKCLPAGR